MSANNHLLDVKNLKKYFPFHGKVAAGAERIVKAVDDVSFWVDAGETLGLVGESGCGKSTLARAILQLSRPTAGEVLFRGENLAALDGGKLRRARREIQMIFQDPYASLNPRMMVKEIISEPLRNYGQRENLNGRLEELLTTVGLDSSAMFRYPHEFSGGQRQRIGIARALALNPALVVADEPASALDVSIQAQILNLLQELQTRLGLSYLFISHDLSVVSLLSHRVAVMYLGEIVELGPTENIFHHPRHPYTEALLASVPEPDPRVERAKTRAKTRIVLRGDIPNPVNRPGGCSFHPRCPYAFQRCQEEKPPLKQYSPGRWVSCHLLEEPGSQPIGRQPQPNH